MNLRRDTIENADSPAVRKLISLSRRNFRLKHMLTLVEGPQALKEALSFATANILDLYFDQAQLATNAELISSAIKANIHIHPVTSQVYATVAPASQGICATLNLKYFLNKQKNITTSGVGYTEQIANKIRPKIAVLLPETQDPGNLGTIIRIADSCAISKVYIAKGSSDPFSPKVIRASAGSIFHLPIHYADFSNCVNNIKDNNFSLVAADVHGEQTLQKFLNETHTTSHCTNPANICYLFGNEARGLSIQQLACCDQIITIPMFGNAESLNVAMAAAITLYETAQTFYLPQNTE